MNEIARVFLDDKARQIKYHKNQMAVNAIEIGRHLKEAKEACFDNDSSWSSWVESICDIKKSQANNYISVFNRFGDSIADQSIGHSLGIAKMLQLAQLPEDTDIDQFVQDNDVENTPVRALARLIKSTKGIDDTERAMIEAKAREEAKAEVENNVASFLEEKEMKIDNLERRHEKYKKEIESLQEKETYLREELKKNKEAEKIRDSIKDLQAERDSLNEEIKEIRELVRLKNNAKELIKALSPVKYSALFHRKKITQVTKNTVNELLDEVNAWVVDVENALNNQSKVIEVS